MPKVEIADGRSVELAVTGMTCVACAARLERRLNRIDGVIAGVNYATALATVRAPDGVPTEQLVAEVERAGYQAAPVNRAGDEGGARTGQALRDLRRRLVVAVLVGAPLAELSMSMAIDPRQRFPGWQWLLLALVVPVAGWCALPFHRAACAAARHRAATMDTLVSGGILASVGWSIYAMFAGGSEPSGHVGGLTGRPTGAIYLDVASVVTIFLLAGRMIESASAERAGSALRALAALRADDVAVLRRGEEHRVPLAQLRVGEEFVVRPGETIATDGHVVDGAAAVDGSAMTGEPISVEVGVGDQVSGATVIVGGRLVVRATHLGEHTRLGRLMALVERAQSDRSAVQRLADRVCGYFVPSVALLALLTFGGWLLVGGALERAFGAALTVMIIACPCALGLATPTALMVAAGRGAELGVFLTGHRALEAARAIDTVVLDKTGTLTSGRLSVVDVVSTAGVDAAELLRVAGALEDASEHPLAAPITELARSGRVPLPAVRQFHALPGLGATGVVEGLSVLVGSPRLMTALGVAVPADLDRDRTSWEARGCCTVAVAIDGRLAGMFALRDTVRPEAAAAVRELHRLGLRTILLTGDNEATANAVATEVGIEEVIAQVLPADKAAVVARLRAGNRSVAVVGDGVNDAPALAGADLGMAMGSGTDVALGAADLVLVRDDLMVVPTAIRLARQTLRVIRGNLCWAFGYNLLALPLAALGALNPLIAGMAMVLSSLLVVTNSLRLRRVRAHPPDATPNLARTAH